MSQGMTAQEREALIAIAGPFFAEANAIDSMYDPNHVPISNGRSEAGSGQAIKHALERDFAAGRPAAPPVHVPAPAPIPEYIPEQVPDYAAQLNTVSNSMPQFNPAPPYDDGQLELNLEYDVSAQKEANRLLEKQNVILSDISKKLGTLVDYLTIDNLPDLEPELYKIDD